MGSNVLNAKLNSFMIHLLKRIMGEIFEPIFCNVKIIKNLFENFCLLFKDGLINIKLL